MTAPARPGFLGSDVDAQQSLDTALQGSAQVFLGIRSRLGRQLDGTEWHGPDAHAFRGQWQSSYAPALQKIVDHLREAAQDVRRQRDQQLAASSGGGVAAPAVGAGAPGATGGSTAAADTSAPDSPATAPTAATGTTTGSAAVTVPFYSQFVGGHGFTPGSTACFRAATAMAAQAGAHVLGPDQRIQVATGERSDGSVTIDAARATEGRSYIDQQLDAGRPVVVGVSHRDASYNVDRITDHFVVVTGRGTDADGSTYYTFHDPSTRYAERGSDTNAANRFHVGENGLMYSDGRRAAGPVLDRHIEVSMVRRNR